MFVEIRPYEKEYLSVRFKARGEDFAKILQSINNPDAERRGMLFS